jgi:hypothetical protein
MRQPHHNVSVQTFHEMTQTMGPPDNYLLWAAGQDPNSTFGQAACPIQAMVFSKLSTTS